MPSKTFTKRRMSLPPCDALPSHLTALCCGESPVFTARQCIAHANAWLAGEGLPLLTEDNAEPTRKVHRRKLVQTRIDEQVVRERQDKPRPPGLLQKAASFGKAMVKHAADGFRAASKEEQESRLVICRECEFYEPADGSCVKCGCCMQLKKRLRTSSCPIGKWGLATVPKDPPANLAEVP